MVQKSFSQSLLGFSRFNWILWGILIFLVLLVIIFFGVGAYAASIFTHPARNFNPELNPGKFGLQYEDVHFPARIDNVDIAAWYIPSDKNQEVIILAHGKDNSRTNGFINLFVPFAAQLHTAGFSVLMIDLRGHGQSADARFTYGIKERRDVLGAVDWLEARGYQAGRIGVLGYSLGAGSVIGAAAEEPAIGAIWLDSAFADIRSVLINNWRTVTGLPQPFVYSADWMIRLLYGYNISAARPIDEIGKIAPRPIFMTHCQNDNLIPISHMDQLLTVAKNTQTWVITNCGQQEVSASIIPDALRYHATGYYFNQDEYAEKVIQFFSQSLK